VELRRKGVVVSLGADGAACNNRLDMFAEMRLAGLLQAARHGPGRLPARDVVWMATRAGARTLGLEADIGSVEAAKLADLIVVGRRQAHQLPVHDPYKALVYSTTASDVRMTIVNGEVLMEDGALARADQEAIEHDALEQSKQLIDRAELS
jgi:5-methylthioadenosine/S-adenosylhomocysteine deaminase